MHVGRGHFLRRLSSALLALAAQSLFIGELAAQGDICSVSVITQAIMEAGTGDNNLELLRNFFIQNFGDPLREQVGSSLIAMHYRFGDASANLTLMRQNGGVLNVRCSRRGASAS